MSKKEPSPICGAKKRSGEGVCKRPAGWGTSHVGTGKCKLHGGASTGPKNGGVHMKGNKFAMKHGLYETITLEKIEPEEREKVYQEPLDAKTLLENSVRLILVREARMLGRIKDLKEVVSGMTVVSMEYKEGIDGGEKSQLKTQKLEATLGQIQTIEMHLTALQGQKTKLITQLYELEKGAAGDDGTLAEFVRQMQRKMEEPDDEGEA